MRRRRFSERKRLICDANITPLVDACLVLLIIFMISSPFIINQAVNISLPKTLSAAEMKQAEELSIYAVYDSKSGKTLYSMGDKKNLAVADIRGMISGALAGRKSSTVRIYADGNVPMKRVIELTDIILGAGGRIQIITEYGEGEKN